MLFSKTVLYSHVCRDSLNGIAVTASNTWGLFVLVILLGYGLVDIPRSAWHRSQLNYSLNYSYFKVAKLRVDLEEAKSTLNEVCGEVKYILQKIRYNDPLYKYVNIIVKKVSETCNGLHTNYSDFITVSKWSNKSIRSKS
jgi:hypothetical protein